MPQMSPLMWQTLFLISIVLLIVSISKNYFTEMKGTNKVMECQNSTSEENMWKW